MTSLELATVEMVKALQNIKKIFEISGVVKCAGEECEGDRNPTCRNL